MEGFAEKAASNSILKNFDKQSGRSILGWRMSVSNKPQIVESINLCWKTMLSGACYRTGESRIFGLISEVKQFFPWSSSSHSFTFCIFGLGLRTCPLMLVIELDVLVFL